MNNLEQNNAVSDKLVLGGGTGVWLKEFEYSSQEGELVTFSADGAHAFWRTKESRSEASPLIASKNKRKKAMAEEAMAEEIRRAYGNKRKKAMAEEAMAKEILRAYEDGDRDKGGELFGQFFQ